MQRPRKDSRSGFRGRDLLQELLKLAWMAFRYHLIISLAALAFQTIENQVTEQ